MVRRQEPWPSNYLSKLRSSNRHEPTTCHVFSHKAPVVVGRGKVSSQTISKTKDDSTATLAVGDDKNTPKRQEPALCSKGFLGFTWKED